MFEGGGGLLKRGAHVLVQGITGREASFWTEKMKEYGTAVVAGVTPGKGGQTVQDVPIYESVQDATRRHRIDASVLFVPPMAVKSAALEAMRAGVKAMVVLAEHVPIQDVIEVVTEARDLGVQIVGPNCPGVVVPGNHFLGIMPAWAKNIFQAGSLGVVSRSGSLGTLICLNLVRAGLGESVFFWNHVCRHPRMVRSGPRDSRRGSGRRDWWPDGGGSCRLHREDDKASHRFHRGTKCP
jgi:succinyl-CoA synthetase alpha subunit